MPADQVRGSEDGVILGKRSDDGVPAGAEEGTQDRGDPTGGILSGPIALPWKE